MPSGVHGSAIPVSPHVNDKGDPKQIRHILSNLNKEALIGDCSECGPGVEVVASSGKRYWLCRKAKRVAQRKNHVRGKYGLKWEDYALLLSVQDGLCAICKTPETPEVPLHVDHDHATGMVRGLLCFNCNAGIGQLKDDVAVLRAAIDYLDMYAHVGPLTAPQPVLVS